MTQLKLNKNRLPQNTLLDTVENGLDKMESETGFDTEDNAPFYSLKEDTANTSKEEAKQPNLYVKGDSDNVPKDSQKQCAAHTKHSNTMEKSSDKIESETGSDTEDTAKTLKDKTNQPNPSIKGDLTDTP